MFNLAVIGATGIVGSTLLEILRNTRFPVDNIGLYASSKSMGKTIEIKNKKYSVMSLTEENVQTYDAAIFCVGNELSAKYAPLFLKHGAFCVDNSSHFRMREDIPLVIPEINGDLISTNQLIANPNCTTAQSSLALYPLQKHYGLSRVVISSYQSASGAGAYGLTDLLERRTDNLLKMPFPIVCNCIPCIGALGENGYTAEEMKQINESKKILGGDFSMTATAVRVPVPYCHCQSINVTLKKPFELTEIENILSEQSGIVYMRDGYPMPITAANKTEVFVGRLRRDYSCENSLNMWVVADNLLKGAAFNAWQIVTQKFFGEIYE